MIGVQCERASLHADAEVAEGDEPAASPAYVMPAAFPTPYYSQFLPPYQNFNPFYPLPSISYTGPHRQPFRQWAPYYYYGGPIQWGAGPASAAPNPPVVVGPAQQPSFLSVSEKVVVLPRGVKLGTGATKQSGMSQAFIEGAVTDAHLRAYEKADTYAPKKDPEQEYRRQHAADKFAHAAIWADKFQAMMDKRANADHDKRIHDMRVSAANLGNPAFAHASFIEASATAAEAEAEAGADLEAAQDVAQEHDMELEQAVEAVEAEAEN